MTIEKLRLQSFRSRADTEIAFGPGLNILAGPIGSGKTSQLYALAAGLTGRNALTKSRGVGLDDQIQTGAKEFTITLDLEHGGRFIQVLRVKSPKAHSLLAVPAAGPGLALQQAAIYQALGCSEEMLLAILDGRPMSARPEEDQRAEVLTVIQPAGTKIVPPATLAPYFQRHLDVTEFHSITEFDTYYDRAYKARAGANRDRDSLVIPEKPAAADPGMASLGDVETDLEGFRKDAGRLHEEKGTLTAQAKQYDALRASLDADARLLEQLRDDMPTASADNVDDLERELGSNRKRLTDVRVMLVWSKERLAAAEETEKLLGQSAAACLVCGRKMTPKSREAARKEAGEWHLKKSDEVKALDKEQQDLERSQDSAEGKIVNARRYAQLRSQHAAQVAERAAELDRNRHRVDELDELVEIGKTRLIEIDAELIVIEERIRNAGEYRTTLLNRETAQKAYDAAVERHRQLDQTCSELQALCDWLCPKGARLTYYGLWVEPFLADLHAAMKACGLDYAVALEDARLMVNGRGVSHLSGGERFIWEFAYRLALARRTGLNFVALDNDTGGAMDRESLGLLCRVAAAERIQIVLVVTVAQEVEAELLTVNDGVISLASLIWFNGERKAVAA